MDESAAVTQFADPQPEKASEITLEALAPALRVRAAVQNNGLVGGIGLMALKADELRTVMGQAGGRTTLAGLLAEACDEALAAAAIAYGIQDDALQAAIGEFLDLLATEEETPRIARKVAEGEAPTPGEDGRIEYCLNHRGISFQQLANLPPRSERKSFHIVHARDVLATIHPPTDPKPGTSVLGEAIPPAQEPLTSARLEEVAGPNTVVSDKELLAECDGSCEEDAAGVLRVVPEIRLKQVDETCARIPESGLTKATLVVLTDITGGHGIASEENVFVGARGDGAVTANAGIQAKNIVVRGLLGGKGGDKAGRLEAEQTCVVGEITNRRVTAESILVLRDCQFGRLEAGADILIDGSVRGGQLTAGGQIRIAGSLGTEAGGSNTRIVLPAESVGKGRARRQATKLRACVETLEEFEEKLRSLDSQCGKRAKADPYWTKLLAGEKVRPQGPVQSKTLMQFVEYVEAKKKLGSNVKHAKASIQALRSQEKAQEENATASEVTISVGGTVHLDVSFEIGRYVDAEDFDRKVRFTRGGAEIQSTLGRARTALLKDVTEFRSQKQAHLDEKKAAIDQMFEEADKKPKVGQIEDKAFGFRIAWVDSETPEGMEIVTRLTVQAKEPDKVVVSTRAVLRQTMNNAVIRLAVEGPQCSFHLGENPETLCPWHETEQVMESLQQISSSGVTASALMIRRVSPPTGRSRQ